MVVKMQLSQIYLLGDNYGPSAWQLHQLGSDHSFSHDFKSCGDEADWNPQRWSLLSLINFQRYDSFLGCVVAMQRGVRRAV